MLVKKPDYRLINHTADLGIKIRGNHLNDLFERAGMAFTDLMLSKKQPFGGTSLEVSLAGDDLEDLMVRWLGEILYLLDGEYLVVNKIAIETLSSFQLKASLKTVPLDSKIHKIKHAIKAVTYHQISVTRKNDQWEAVIFFDV